MKAERRRSPRYSVRQVVEIGHGRQSVLWGDAINLSSSGILCRTSDSVFPSSRVLVSMVLPNGARVDCEGIVVRSELIDGEYRTAIKFDAFHGKGSVGLERFLTYLGSKTTSGREGTIIITPSGLRSL